MLEMWNEPSLRGLAPPVRPQNGCAVLQSDRQVTGTDRSHLDEFAFVDLVDGK